MSEIDVEVERARFEAWMRSKQFQDLKRAKGLGSANYANNRTQGQWHAWLAAKRDAEAEKVALRETLLVAEQAFREMHHAHTDPMWFTRTHVGADQQFRHWSHKAKQAFSELEVKYPTTHPAQNTEAV